jgi:predicted DNA-binding protein
MVARCEACVGEGSAERSERTTLSLSLTVEDKRTLKLMAAERGTTIAAIIHEWVQEHIEEVER